MRLTKNQGNNEDPHFSPDGNFLTFSSRRTGQANIYVMNVDGTFVMLEAARRHAVKRFVYVASSSCYGIPEQYPTPETAPIDTRYPYALTKYLGEQMVLHWAQVYALPALSLRFFNVYGPRARTSGTYGAVFGVFLAQLLAGKPLRACKVG